MLIIGILLLASSLSFGLGYLAGLDAREASTMTLETSPLAATSIVGQVVASKSGTKYYLSSCAGAARITEANKVWFASAALALKAGYTPSSTCKGL